MRVDTPLPPVTSEDVAVTLAAAMAAEDSGLVAIRRWLEGRRDAWRVDEVMVVTEHPSIGRQVFRSSRGPLGTGWAARVARQAPPGLYTMPQLELAATDRELAAQLCARAFELDVARERSLDDALTGLRNRAGFDAAFAPAIGNAERYGWSTSLVLIDLDHFKEINDRYGHTAGDEVLCTVGDGLHRILRRGDVAARVGGDEFALLVADIEPAELPALMVRLEASIRARVPFGPVALSWGEAFAPEEGAEPSELYRLADQRLYERKRGQRGA